MSTIEAHEPHTHDAPSEASRVTKPILKRKYHVHIDAMVEISVDDGPITDEEGVYQKGQPILDALLNDIPFQERVFRSWAIEEAVHSIGGNMYNSKLWPEGLGEASELLRARSQCLDGAIGEHWTRVCHDPEHGDLFMENAAGVFDKIHDATEVHIHVESVSGGAE